MKNYITVTYGKDCITEKDIAKLHKIADSLGLTYKDSLFVEIYEGSKESLEKLQKELGIETELGWMFWPSDKIYAE